MVDHATGARNPLDRLLDLVVYAPLGLALRAREELPTLAARGRDKFSSEANLARMVGQMAVSQGRRRVESLLSRPAAAPVPAPAAGSATAPAGDARPDRTQQGGARPGRPVPVHDLDASAPLPVVAAEALPEPTPDSVPVPAPTPPEPDDLPIPGYDSLSASQVVQRLPGLSPAELEAVRSYEAAGRARKTVLLRVAQLRAAS